MRLAEKTRNLRDDLVNSFEGRVARVRALGQSKSRSLKEAARTRVSESWPLTASRWLQRDSTVAWAASLARQEAREKAVKRAMRRYLAGQRELAAALEEALAGREAEGNGTVRGLFERLAARQEEREGEVTALLSEFQSKQEEMMRPLERFLST